MESWSDDIEFPETNFSYEQLEILNENIEDFLTSQDDQSLNEESETVVTPIEQPPTSANRRQKRRVNITNLLVLSQRQAAKVLGIASSTLNKRWREVTSNRIWPNKIIAKIDSDIELLKLNCPKDENGKLLDPNIESQIKTLQERRNEEMTPVVIEL